MQVGDLVRFVGQLGLGVVVEVKIGWNGRHSHRVLFSGTGYDVLNGCHWCDPSTLEVL